MLTEDAVLLTLARSISEGTPADWDAMRSSARTEALRALIDELKIVAEIADVHRRLSDLSPSSTPPSFQSSDLGPGPAAGAPASATRSLEDLPERWGQLNLLEKVGEGAFGEVYRAWDPRLAREVALKLSRDRDEPDASASLVVDEGQLLARVRHPNVVTVYGAERVDGGVGVWMEFIHGRTLEQMLRAHGPFGAREATGIGIDLCRALSAVHRAGLLHRDIKPQNVMREQGGRIILMDFGAGKTRLSAVVGTADRSAAGTPLYLAPEILDGQDATIRSDIYSLGVLLYHLVTDAYPLEARRFDEVREAHRDGRRIALHDARPDLPDRFVEVIERSIAVKPADRMESAGALETTLRSAMGLDSPPLEAVSTPSGTISVATTTPQAGTRRRLAWAIAAVCGTVLAGALALGAMGYFQRAPVETRAYRTSILPPEHVVLTSITAGRFALAPDGRRLAFVARRTEGEGRDLLWVRSLDALTAVVLAGTEGASGPFWSPDSRFVGFFADGKLKKIDASGGQPLTLADADPSIFVGGTWNQDDVILLGGSGRALLRVSASGGTPSPVTTLDAKSGDRASWLPFFLPDGRHFLYCAPGPATGDPATGDRCPVYVGSLDSNERKLLLEGSVNTKYAQGYLLFLRDTTLMAQPFDVERLELTGDAVPVAEQVATTRLSRTGAFSVSTTGVLAYQTGSLHAHRLVWLDRRGKEIGVLGEDQAGYGNVELSPDGKWAAVHIQDPARKTRDLWLFDVARGLRTRFTSHPADENPLIWSPDGSRVVFGARPERHLDLYQKEVTGAGAQELLLTDDFEKYPMSWSPDGRFILYVAAVTDTFDVWVLPLFGDRKPFPLLQTPFSEPGARFSPDGQWVAYTSDESGRAEVYVAPFPGPGGKTRISMGGGIVPRWRRDGKELFYLAPDDTLMAATVNGEGRHFDVGAVRPLFVARGRAGTRFPDDVSADGQRFLVNTHVEGATSEPITLVVNWTAGLTR